MTRVLLAVEGVPEPATSGGSLAMWSLIQELQRRGNEVTAVILVAPWDSQRDLSGRAELLERRGVRVHLIQVPSSRRRRPMPQRLRAVLRPAADDLYPHGAVASQLFRLIEDVEPHVVLGFDTGTLVALRAAAGRWPTFAVPGDPLYQVWRAQMILTPLRERLTVKGLIAWLRYCFGARSARRIHNRLAEEFDAVGVFGAQHAEEQRRRGVDCLYLPIPVVDSGVVRRDGDVRSPPEILILGGLRSTATQLGLVLVAGGFIAELETRLGENWRMEVAGSGTLPTRLEALLSHPNISVTGYVEDSAAAARSCDVFLVPTPYSVGARTRIVEALSVGAIVVAHRAAAAGIPELEHGVNAMLGDDASDLARMTAAVLSDEGLRRSLREGARTLYERAFVPHIACAPLADRLERLAVRS